jgi:hypothetical protein
MTRAAKVGVVSRRTPAIVSLAHPDAAHERLWALQPGAGLTRRRAAEAHLWASVCCWLKRPRPAGPRS